MTDENALPHWEIAEKKGWIDFERGVKVTGAGFPFYIGKLASLQRALNKLFYCRGKYCWLRRDAGAIIS